MSNDDGKPQEILIIRRGGGDDGFAAKGGAWKIAYADFVTAMMAFFLVMWLINSANEVTKARVASYFNPIKMTDASPAPKGLKEKTDAQLQIKRNAKEDDGLAKEVEETSKILTPSGVGLDENKMLMNPYRALDELLKMSNNDAESGLEVEESSRIGDPFNPRSFELYEQKNSEAENQEKKPTGASVSVEPDKIVSGRQLPETETLKPRLDADRSANEKDGTSAKQSDTETELDSPEVDVAVNEMSPKKDVNAANPKDENLVERLKKQIEDKVVSLQGRIDINVKVEATDEGLLVVLEDGKGRSMFSVGSALPNPALIEIVGSIGELLAATEGSVIIRGHTDGRQFRNRKYDNWQLSTDRAHMASYMLIRGGLPETRISRIEGYGSSVPVEAGQLMLDANRRVEFLLKK